MKKARLYILIGFLGAGLTACSSYFPTKWSSNSLPITAENAEANYLDSLITPYRKGLETEMNRVIGESPENLVKGRPCSGLNNWAADALLKNQISFIGAEHNILVLLNVGGLRSSINKGPIHVGDLFSLMPFDNEIVCAKMPFSALVDIENYLIASGGEPIANASLKQGKLIFDNPNPNEDYFWIITSDYLLNGGDKMDFFQLRTETVLTGKMLRDAFIEEVVKEKLISIDNTCRIDEE